MLDRHKSSFLFVKSLFNFSMQFFPLNSRSVFLLQFFEIKGLTIWQWKKVFFIVLLLFIVHYVISVRNQKNVLFVFRHKKTQKRNQQQQQHTKQQKKWIRRTMFCRVFFFHPFEFVWWIIVPMLLHWTCCSEMSGFRPLIL